MNVVKTFDITPIHVGESDTLSVTYHDAAGKEHKLVAGAEIPGGAQVVDCIKVVQLDDELGFETGFGALLGKKKK